jgi:hypothetical protein
VIVWYESSTLSITTTRFTSFTQCRLRSGGDDGADNEKITY